jgi:hypothetical protein
MNAVWRNLNRRSRDDVWMSDPNNATSLLRKIKEVNLRLVVNAISPSPLSIQATTKTFRLHSRHRGLFSTCVLLSASTTISSGALLPSSLNNVVSHLLISYNTAIKMAAVCLTPAPERICGARCFHPSSMIRRGHKPHRPSMGWS